MPLTTILLRFLFFSALMIYLVYNYHALLNISPGGVIHFLWRLIDVGGKVPSFFFLRFFLRKLSIFAPRLFHNTVRNILRRLFLFFSPPKSLAYIKERIRLRRGSR
ncbi:hypothetical protein GGR52DRAFT_305767 [Hypoxylon sp. FL1284]|nr:hypothetical protein GGR52DRAFT_305767 [Hypoxylon sp. FL1284]